MKKLKKFKKPAIVFAGIGAANWGLAEFFGWNLVKAITGWAGNWLAMTVYGVVAVSGILTLYWAFKK